MRRKKIKRVIVSGSATVLGLLVLAMLFPITPTETHATCIDGTATEDCAKSYARTDVSMTTNTVIALTLENAVTMDVTPKVSGATTMGAVKLGVSTNSSEGYGIYLKTGNGDGALLPVTSSITGEIKNTERSTTLEGLETNSYGYALTSKPADEETIYSGVPVEGRIIQSTDTVTVENGEYAYGDEYYLSFGTKVGTSLPAGTYTGSVILSVVANPTTLRSLYDLTYMQEMTSDICTNTKEHYTKQLIDTRDGKSYWVAKLKDGNCWMTQNLALDLDVNGEGNAVAVSEGGKTVELDKTNTDIEDVWKGATKTETEIPLPNTANNANMRSWNLGTVVLSSPISSKLCPAQDSSINGVPGQNYPNSDTWDSAFTGQNIAEVCGSQFINVSNGWTAGYISTETSSVDETAKTYDAHYLIGNYYQYNTATAGTGIGLTGTNATDAEGNGLTNAPASICPKGWQLPKAGRNASATETVFGVGPGESYEIDKSFYGLLNMYNYTREAEWNVNGGSAYTSIISTVAELQAGISKVRLDYNPLYFGRSGSVDPSSGSLRAAGRNGLEWASTVCANVSGRSYNMFLDGVNIVPSNDSNYYNGLPLRCVAK